MNRKDMRRVIKDTLESIDHFYDITKSDINLIELTFLMESNMNDLYHTSSSADLRGFMMISKSQLEDIILNTIKPSKKAVDNILTVSLVDVTEDRLDDVFEAATYNIAFQVSILFYFYFKSLTNMPNNVEDCVDAYYKKWKSKNIYSTADKHNAIKKFITYDKEVKDLL